MKASKLLLDTHVFIWWRSDPSRIPASVRRRISEAELVFVSAASEWEAGIKSAVGRLELPESIEAGAEKSGFEKLVILFSHAATAASLPPHHRDPFDRLLVAQAILEGLTLVSHDRRMELYSADVLWC